MPRSDDNLELPPFLLRRKAGRPGGGRQTEPEVHLKSSIELVSEKPVERVQLTEFVRLAETPSEEAGFAVEKGVLPRRWYDGNPESEQVIQMHLRMSERELRSEKRAEREAKPEKGSWKAERVSLEELLMPMRPKVEVPYAKKALRAAGIENVRWWVLGANIAVARQAIREYVPGKRSVKSDDLDRSAVILFGGKNPKKEGTGAHERWAHLMSHHRKSVGEFLAAKGNPTTLKNAVKSGHVKLQEKQSDQVAEVEAPANGKERKSKKGTAGRRDGGRRRLPRER